MRSAGILILLFFVFTSCFRNPEKDRIVLARVNNTFLYEDQIQGMIPSSFDQKDSAGIVSRYIENWIEQQVILSEASVVLNSREKDFSAKIREYRNALLIFEWEKKILSEKLDTIITDLQISEYYEANQNEFILQADIVRVLYIKLNMNNILSNTAKELMIAEPFDRNETEQFCRKFAVNYFLDLRSWLYVEDILKEIPLSAQQKNEMSTGNTFLELNDDEYTYLLKVLDVKVKGTVSPLALEENTIREVMMQKRKSDILEKHVRELKSKAERDGSVKRFVSE
jgi:hypothetical protein